MSKIEEEVAEIIPLNEYVPELEKEVAYYLAIADKPTFISKRRYTASNHPLNFKDPREGQEYWIEQIRRCREGYDGLTGKGYSWVEFAKVRDPGRGKISPEFRVKQEEYFRKIEKLQANPGRGLVGFKRRRFGFSAIAGWDIYHDCALSGRDFYQVGMNSKGESDSRRLFQTVKFYHQNIPQPIKPLITTSDRRDYMEFSYWWDHQKGKPVSQSGPYTEKRGSQSWIFSTSPVPQAHEGNAYSKLLIDEAGKQPELMDLWGFSEDCLIINTRRVGIPIILGTVGDIDKDGKGLMELYTNSDSYDLDKFCVYGYNGLIMDEFGNDRIEDAIRWIVYKRYKYKSASKKTREAFIQKYPLCEKDAFNYVSGGGVGNIELINEQILNLSKERQTVHTGRMRRNPDGTVDFVPSETGKIRMYSPPDKRLINGYVAGGDPADHDNKKKKKNSDISDLAIAIVAKPMGVGAPQLVAEYVDRPEKLDEFFEQSAMLLEFYNKTKILLEDNRERMLNYFKKNYPHLLPLVPVSIKQARHGYEMKNSVTMTEARKQQMMGLIEDNIDHYCSFIPSIKLLEQFKVFGDLHADDDLAIAYGWALILLQSDKRPVKYSDTVQAKPNIRTRFIYRDGRMQRVGSDDKPITRVGRVIPKLPNS